MSLIGGLVWRDTTRPVAEGRGVPGLPGGTSETVPAARITLPGGCLLAQGERAACAQWGGVAGAFDLDLTNLDEVRTAAAPEAPFRFLEEGFRRHGARFLTTLRGAFALALWWPGARRLVLAADRFGVRRLYYAATPDGIAFGARVRIPPALLGLASEVAPEAVYAYLNFGTVPAPQTIYRAVRRLPPGHALYWEDGQVRVEPYWDMQYPERPLPRATAAAALVRHTEEAVREALSGADVKHTGAFLSGGTDSSTVLGLMTRITGERESAIASDVGLAHGVWQFDAWAATYDGARTVADEVLGALKRQEFTAASVDVLEALLEREHELYEPEARLYRVSMDLTVWYRE